MNSQQIDWLRVQLQRHADTAAFADSRKHAAATLAFVERSREPWRRSTLEGHLTASAWVLDRRGSHAALIHHRKLDRWFQPGGHVEDSDTSWIEASRREVSEETGLVRFVDDPRSDALFDVDVHPIPARKDEPAHLHYDLRFLFIADVDASDVAALSVNMEESHDCRWFALDALARDPAVELSLARMVQLSVPRTAPHAV